MHYTGGSKQNNESKVFQFEFEFKTCQRFSAFDLDLKESSLMVNYVAELNGQRRGLGVG
jgi:hypothetical protein